MIARVTWGRVQPGKWAEFEQAYRQVVLRGARDVPGLKGRMLLRSTSNPNEGFVISFWESAEALKHYEESEVFARGISPALRPYFSGEFTTTHCEAVVEEVYV